MSDIDALIHFSNVHREAILERNRHIWQVTIATVTFFALSVPGFKQCGYTPNFILILFLYLGLSFVTIVYLGFLQRRNVVNRVAFITAEKKLVTALSDEFRPDFKFPKGSSRSGFFKMLPGGKFALLWQSIVILLFAISTAFIIGN